jgi:hypothetical protein
MIGFASPAAIALFLLATFAIWSDPRVFGEPRQARSTATAHYQCDASADRVRHTRQLSDLPDELQRVDDGQGRADGTLRTPLFYRHPMRADVVSPVPAQDEMGMAHILFMKTRCLAQVTFRDAPFTLSRERQQLIGVTSDAVERRDLEVEIRAAGRVAYDPKLYQAVVEYREALRTRGAFRGGLLGDSPSAGDAILRGARSKLLQQGLSDDLIEAFVKRGQDPGELLLPGASVWIYAQVYEYEAPS